MADEWQTERFERMAQLVRDTVHPSEAVGLPYIGLEHIGEGSLALVGKGIAEDATSLKNRFKKGDILFGKLRPYFRKVIRAPFDGISSTDIWIVRPRQGVDPGYLFYLMASDMFLEPIVRASEGTKMPRAKWDYAAGLELPLPPLPEQRAIAHVLGALDDRIELNRRMSETLEQIARALFRSWFVDFEPVRAKMEGRWRRGESLPGLPSHLYDLFPDRLVESELGEIPEGWRVVPLGEIAEVTSGKRPDEVSANRTDKNSIPLWGGNGPMGYVREPLFGEPILLTGRVGTLGSVFRIATPCWPSDNTLVVKPRRPIYLEYVYLSMMRLDFDSLNCGSTQPLLTQTDLRNQRLTFSSNILLGEFHAKVATLFAKIDVANDDSCTLAALRDALLPKLIRGEIRVMDAERFLEVRGL